ncbi:aquaporin [Pontimonas sp.]|nr:aquaporin [Pontimonas sp.]MDA8909523.1 aquaporin [Pontimonas sp.]
MTPAISIRVAAEFLGTLVLVLGVVGSGIMANDLSADRGIALLGNTLSTILVLAVLIYLFLPVSGAHFNPVVSLVMVREKALSLAHAALFIPAQIAGGIVGAMLANLLFGLPLVELSTTDRVSAGTLMGEGIATAGLIMVIVIAVRRKQAALLVWLVPAWIGAAYFFTSSTSFANPAVTVGRMFSDTFAGIAPSSAPGFITAQIVGGAIGALLALVFARKR